MRFTQLYMTSPTSSTVVQFRDTITGKHVGFPESELNVLCGSFKTVRSGAAPRRDRLYQKPNRVVARPITGSSRSESQDSYGADWTAAVACLRVLACPKESTTSSLMGIFEVFARARGDRLRHRLRLGREDSRKDEGGEVAKGHGVVRLNYRRG